MLKKFILFALLIFSPAPANGAEVLHLVTSLDPTEANEYIKAFEDETGIDVEWIRLSAGEVVARLRAEGKNQTQSVWFGGPMPEFVAAKNVGLLKPYKPKGWNQINKRWKDPDGYFTGIYFGSIVFIVNKKYRNENKLPLPKKWADLLKDEWKGRIAIAYPYTAGTGYTILAGLISKMGEGGAYNYWKQLDPSVHHYTKSGTAPIIEVGLGEASLGVVFAQDAVRKGLKRGFPIEISYPEDGAPHEIGAVALLGNAPQEKTAKKFIDWIISKSGQDQFHKFGRTPLHPAVKIPSDVKRPSEINLIEMDMIKLGKERARYVDKWRRELKQ